MAVDQIASIVKRYCKGTYFGDLLINFVRIRGIDEKLFIFQMKRQYAKDAKHPTKEMMEARKFFQSHKRQINRVIRYLEDDESKECLRQCIAYRCTHNMKQAPKNTKGRYFVKGIIKMDKGEVFVDGGAFVGDTVRELVKRRAACKRIISFEPDKYNFAMLSRLKYDNVVKINKGLWNENGTLRFSNGGGCGSKVTNDADTYVEVVKLDDMPQCKDVSFIKLDIEGAELNALKGAEHLIKKNHPKLAVCIYHKDADMLNIIDYIHGIEPRYHLYVRHHSGFTGETVMYAVF